MRQDVGVDGPEGALWSLLHALGECVENASFEVGARVRRCHGVERLPGEIVSTDAEDVGLDACGDQRCLGVQEFGHSRCGVQCDAEPHLSGGGLVGTVVEKEIAGSVRAVHLESQRRFASVRLRQAEVMEHRADVEQFQIDGEATTATLQRAEQEHTPGVVEEEVVLTVADEVGGGADDRRVRYIDPRDGGRA